MPKQRVNVTIDEQTNQRLLDLAKEAGATPNQIILRAVQEFCPNPPQSHRAGDVLLDIWDVANRLSVKRSTVEKLVRLGLAGDPAGLKSLRVGRLRRFHPDDVTAYIQRQRQPVGRAM
jgi:excisionase family DNA binding protein